MTHGPYRAAERGTVLVFTLVALAVLLIGGVALVRAMDTALLQAGNLAFHRDLVNQSERAIRVASAKFTGGVLATEAARQLHQSTANYYASRLASDAHGIPRLLLSEAAWAAAGLSGGDITDPATGVTLRWVMDRQCAATGEFSGTDCVTLAASGDNAVDDRYRQVNGQSRPVYRISVRATGPRNTLAFFQATVVK